MDFGIGKVMQAIRKSTTHSIGTLQYMSPEQIDAGAVDHRSDLYSLGLVLYEMLAGAPPFSSESPRELLNQQCTTPPPPLPEDVRAQLPRGVERLLLKLLEKQAANRPATAQEVVTALDPFVTATGTAAPIPAARTPASSGSMPAAPSTLTAAAASSPTTPIVTPNAPVPVAPRLDTIALIERAGKPREIATSRAIAIIVAACALTAFVVYAVRHGWIG
jgi:serine/threonine-protein kinase